MAVTFEREYEPFANVPARNLLQQNVEIPLFVAALRLPKGGRVLELGCARGYILKRSVMEELLLAIRAAYRGEFFLSPSVSELLSSPKLANCKSWFTLSPTE